MALPDAVSVGLWDAESAAAAAEAAAQAAAEEAAAEELAAEELAAASPARPLAWTQPHNCAVRCVAAMEDGGGGAFVSLSSRQLHVYRRRR